MGGAIGRDSAYIRRPADGDKRGKSASRKSEHPDARGIQRPVVLPRRQHDRLTAIYNANADQKTPKARLAAAGRAYLAFAADRPQLFRLMFVSDLLGQSTAPPDPALIRSAGAAYVVFESLVAATLDRPDDRAIKAAAIAIMSTSYGFALLRMNDRLKPFMYGTLTQSDLINAVLSIKLVTKTQAGGRKAHRKTHSPKGR